VIILYKRGIFLFFAGSRMLKNEFTIKRISRFTSTTFVQQYHYSPVVPAITKYHLGFYLGNKLVGVVTLGYGTRPRHTLNKIFPVLKNNTSTEVSEFYLEIGKMCFSPELNGDRNSGSKIISLLIQWMRTNTRCLFLYTLSDGIMGKCGYVYQSSNFLYGGKYWTDVYMMENGEKLHPRSCKELCKENLEWEQNRNNNFVKNDLSRFTHDWMLEKGITHYKGYMFRYIYPLHKRSLNFLINYSSMEWTKNYPKDNELKWRNIGTKTNVLSAPFPEHSSIDVIYNLKNVEQHKTPLNLLNKFIPKGI